MKGAPRHTVGASTVRTGRAGEVISFTRERVTVIVSDISEVVSIRLAVFYVLGFHSDLGQDRYVVTYPY